MPIASPLDIPDLVFWGSAEYEDINYADGQSMTQWTDLSGLDNHALAVGTLAPQWQASTGPGSGPAVKFRGTHGSTSATWGYFELPTGIMGAAASGEIHVTIKSDGTNSSHWWLGQNAGSGGGNHYPFSGRIYESFGSLGGQRDTGVPVLAITDWRRYNVWAAASDFASRLDGVSQFSSSSNTVSWSNTPLLGHTGRNSAVSTNSGSFQGHMAAVVLYKRKLTTTERADLDAWLTANPTGGLPPEATDDPLRVAQMYSELLASGERLDVASTRLGLLLLEYVPIYVSGVRVSAVVNGSPWVRTAASHVEVLIQEMPGLRTVPGIPVHVKHPDGRWEWPWHHHGEDPPP